MKLNKPNPQRFQKICLILACFRTVYLVNELKKMQHLPFSAPGKTNQNPVPDHGSALV
jgi:hypothetical protein